MGRGHLLAWALAASLLAAALGEPEAENPMAALLELPAAAMHLSAERAEEVAKAKEGDVTSTGRVLTSGIGVKTDSLASVQEWAKAPEPRRTRDYMNHHMNSDKWDLVDKREGDIIIATAYKSGTTWMQAIMYNLLFKDTPPPEGAAMMDLTPWVDLRLPPPAATAGIVGAQTHRRFLKTHLPLDGHDFRSTARYVVVIRDARDVGYSWHNHWTGMSKFWHILNTVKGRFGPSMPVPTTQTAHDTFRGIALKEGDAEPVGLWSYYHHMATWWAYRRLENVLMVHYADLKADLPGQVARVAKHVGIPVTPEEAAAVANKTTFTYMKDHAEELVGSFMDLAFDVSDGVSGGKKFINKGTNGRWQGEVTPEEEAAYEAYAKERLGEEAAEFLFHGSLKGKAPAKDEL